MADESKRRNYLLDVYSANGSTAQFVLEGAEKSDPQCSLMFDRASWDAMGRPGCLLVSLTPSSYEPAE